MTILAPDPGGILIHLVRGMVEAGLDLQRIPAAGRLPQNRLPLIVLTPTAQYRYRLLAHTVGGSSRDRPDERRVQVTSTFPFLRQMDSGAYTLESAFKQRNPVRVASPEDRQGVIRAGPVEDHCRLEVSVAEWRPRLEPHTDFLNE